MSILTHPALLTALISGLILFQVHRHNAYRAASEKFRNTVMKELEGLYPTPAKWPSRDMDIIKILKDKFPKLEIAVTEFSIHLGWLKKKRFAYAWEQFNREYYFDYIPISGNTVERGVCTYSYDYTKTYHDNFKRNVDALLDFAK